MLAQVTDEDVDMEDQEDLITNVGMVAFVGMSAYSAVLRTSTLRSRQLEQTRSERERYRAQDRSY